jgi:hypothetical protein
MSFLYRGIPRSFLVLMALFLVVYALYWAVGFAGTAELQQPLVHALGLLAGIVLAITTLRLWPRLEEAVPRWFRAEIEAPSLRRHHKFLAWAGAIGIVVLCTAFILDITMVTILLMGLTGGAYILFRLESRFVRRLDDVRSRLPWLWNGSGWRAFLLMLAMLIVLTVVVIVVGAIVGPNEDPVTHEVKVLPTLAAIIPIIALVIQGMVLAAFVLVQVVKWLLSRFTRKPHGPYTAALLRTHPSSMAYYLWTLNFATGAFFFVYALMLLLQTISYARSEGVEVVGVDISGPLMISGEALGLLALLSFVIAWIILLLNLSGTAARDEERRVLNRRVFASLGVFFVMVLFVHVIVAQGDEFSVSLSYRIMYLAGIALAPLLITWRRWKAMARRAG